MISSANSVTKKSNAFADKNCSLASSVSRNIVLLKCDKMSASFFCHGCLAEDFPYSEFILLYFQVQLFELLNLKNCTVSLVEI